MCILTRSRSRLIDTSPTIPTQHYRRRRKRDNIPEIRTLVEEPIIEMAADQRTMQELLQCPTEGYGDAIVLPLILFDNFELKTGLIQLVTANQFTVLRGTILTHTSDGSIS